MKNKIMPTLVLTCICLVVAIMLAGINMITEPFIKKAADDAASETLSKVLSTGKDFQKIDPLPDAIKSLPVTDVWKAGNGAGYVFRTSTAGYKPGMIVMCGISSDGKIAGSLCLDSQETYGFENKLDGAYNGVTLDSLELIIASGASQKSLTSRGYYDGIDAALKAFTVLTGGSVNLGSPEEILQDNCNKALGTENLEFKRWLRLTEVDTVDMVYFNADAGYVYVIGDRFIGITVDGDITTVDISSEDMTAALTAHAAVSAITIEKLEALPEGVNPNIVKSVYAASNGTYAFVLSTRGFEYSPAPIEIKLSIGSDGKIIDVFTVSHEESKGYGDACADEDYYKGWFGAGASDIKLTPFGSSMNSTDIGVISGATETTRGYQTAVKAAFAAFEILTAGGAE